MATAGGSEPSAYLTRGFLFADLRGYTEFAETHGNRAAAELLDDYRRLVRDVVQTFGGAEIKTEGDSFYIVFPSASGAVRCGLAISEAAAAASGERPERPIRVGIGIHAGETSETDEGFVGSAVNIAARVCAQAAAGEVLVTDTVRSLTRASGEVAFTARGRPHLKGIAESVALYQVKSLAGQPMTAVLPARRGGIRSQRSLGVIAGLGALGVVLVIAAVAVFGGRPASGLGTQTAGTSQASIAASASTVAGASGPSSPAGSLLPELTPQAKITIPAAPSFVAVTTDAVWVARYGGFGGHNSYTTTLERVDPRTNHVVATIDLDEPAGPIAGDGTDLWVSLGATDRLVRIAGATNGISAAIAGGSGGVEARSGSVWVSAGTKLFSVSSRTNKIVRTIDLGRNSSSVAVTPDAVWVSGDSLWHIDPSTGRIVATFNVQGQALAVGAGSVWVVEPKGESIIRVDGVGGRTQARIAGPSGTLSLAFGEGSLWALGGGAYTTPVEAFKIDPASNRATRAVVLWQGRIGERHQNFEFQASAGSQSIATGFGSVWICNIEADELWRIDPGS